MIQFFYVETSLVGVGAACQQPLKFELRTAEDGVVYKIWALVYKIVQNKYRIMMYFSLSKSVFWGQVTCTECYSRHSRSRLSVPVFISTYPRLQRSTNLWKNWIPATWLELVVTLKIRITGARIGKENLQTFSSMWPCLHRNLHRICQFPKFDVVVVYAVERITCKANKILITRFTFDKINGWF